MVADRRISARDALELEREPQDSLTVLDRVELRIRGEDRIRGELRILDVVQRRDACGIFGFRPEMPRCSLKD
jgi:hypothetical protein